jgi:hypothetical protein
MARAARIPKQSSSAPLNAGLLREAVRRAFAETGGDSLEGDFGKSH